MSAAARTQGPDDPDDPDGPDAPMTMADLRSSFYYGDHADMQFKYLEKLGDVEAADAIAELLATVGEVLDTGDLDRLREVAFRLQAAAYMPDAPPGPTVDDAPFTPLRGPLRDQRLALISAGGVFVRDDDPMGPDGPSQLESLELIKVFLRGAPTLSTIPVDTAPADLTARHPGYDARTAQRDPDTVFPLSHLRELADEGRFELAPEHYAFAGTTSQRRLENEVAPQWAEHMAAREIDVCLLVAT